MLSTEGMLPLAFRSWQVEDRLWQVQEALCLLRQEHCRLADRMLLQRLQHDGWLPAVGEATEGPAAAGPAGHKAQSSTSSIKSTTATAALAAAGRFTRPSGPSKSAACTTTAAAAAAGASHPLPEATPQTAPARKAAAAAAASRAALMDHQRIEIQRMEYRAKIHSKAGAPIYGFLGRLWWGLQGLMQTVSFARPSTPSSAAEDVPDDLTAVELEDAGHYMQDILKATRTHRALVAAAGRQGAAAAGVSWRSGGQAEAEPASTPGWLEQLDAALAPSEGSWCCDMPEDGLQV